MGKSRSPKLIPFFENSQDNVHCLQSCVKSLLSFHFPDASFTDEEIDRRTAQVGGWSWLPPAGVWFNELGLSVKLYSPFNYKEFGKDGEEYLKRTWQRDRFEHEKKNGAFGNLKAVQIASAELATRGLWEGSSVKTSDLATLLMDAGTFAIGKTIYEWMDGRPGGISHFVLLIGEYGPGVWRVHDPGLPGKENRKIPQMYESHDILGDVMIVGGK